jgi:cellulose synthase/poly-beta-1,6-N-acetylglucosamine synthase-like glycosyltransferase
MMMVVKTVFWLSVSGIIYAWVIYPLLVWVLARLSSKRASSKRLTSAANVDAEFEWPLVTLVIAAYREESVILDRLNNAVMLDYPPDRLQILIGCDGDEDLTGEVVNQYADERVRLLQYPVRRGKASVLNDTVREATGDIIVFSDANTHMRPDAIKKLVCHFADSEVGGVCGQLVLTDPLTGRNVDGIYWSFENFLKRNEAKVGGLLGVNGAIYAIRRELFSSIPPNTIVDDFLIGMRIHLHHRKLVYEPNAMAFEETAPTISGEFNRRVRIGAGNFQSLRWLLPLLNPKRGTVALTFFSHKLMRWLCPVFLLAGLISNIFLIEDLFYSRTLALQIVFYVSAMAGLKIGAGPGWKKLLRLPTMFVAMNIALLCGFFRLISTTQCGTWQRTERSEAERVHT